MAILELSYREKNENFLKEYKKQEGVKELRKGVLYRELIKGSGAKPTLRSIVTIHYQGKMINGKVFDSTQGGPSARFRLNELIEGWQIALPEMQVGTKWEIVLPYQVGYGMRSAGKIKGFSTLIFEIQLLAVQV